MSDHKPQNTIVRLNDFTEPETIYVKHAYKTIPFIDMAKPVELVPLTVDISNMHEEAFFMSEYEWNGKVYRDDMACMLKVGDEVYYVVTFDMNDPSCGLFGIMGSWIPYRTILYDSNKEAISEHSEKGNASHVRIKDCTNLESLVRFLTVWGMVDSTYKEEISEYNAALKNSYKALIDLNEKIKELYRKREGLSEDGCVLMYDIGNNTFEAFMQRNRDLD